jgi:Gram-negative bacterial TonB protein C-terminal
MDKLIRILGLPAAAALAGGAGPLPPARQPIAGWVVDYGDSACTALRTYGSEAGPITLAFRPSPNGNVVRLVVARPGRGPTNADQFNVVMNISPPSLKTTGLRFVGSDGKSEVVWINARRSDLEGLRQAGEIAIRGGPVADRFALPGIGKVLDALDTCNADLRRYWNVGEHSPAVAKPAAPLKPLIRYFSSDDYPAEAVARADDGRSVIMMMIDEKGILKDCLVEETSGIASLDAMTCIVLRDRAKFRPALDAAGRPVRSVLTQTVVWRISVI